MTDPLLTLALETSTPVASVALGRADIVLAEVVLGAETRQSEQLLPAIDYLLRAAAIPRTGLGRIVIGGGPGSFTGLRIAAATAKGMVASLGVELFAFSGLLAVASATGVRDRTVCTLFDARRDEVYAACYRITDRIETLMPPRVDRVDHVLADPATEASVFAGEGALRHAGRIRARGATVLPMHNGVPRASALLWLAQQYPEQGRVATPQHWEPDYLRAPGVEPRNRP